MRISDIFRRHSLDQTTAKNSAQQAKDERESSNSSAIASNSDDRVSISPMARQFAQISKIVAEDEEKQSSRVEDLKRKIAAGEYSVSSSDVANSILSFAKDENA
ncbi:MAG: flagellar biosynthesis anti-sigma factor FlgM [Deltaproteobacteria bacterium]|nr:flagellar biosynthesis anti-sigma factor FlgM [Deltaproteobacteria bacterium]